MSKLAPKPPASLTQALQSSFTRTAVKNTMPPKVQPIIDFNKDLIEKIAEEKIAEEKTKNTGDGQCEALMKSGLRCTNRVKKKNNGLCGVHAKLHVTRYDPNTYSNVHPLENDHCRQVREFAEMKLKEHQLNDWRFEWDKAGVRFGCCHYRTKRITISLKLTKINKMEQCQDTVLHEIAHALAPKDHHGRIWHMMCCKVGAEPRRCYDHKEVQAVESKYVTYCTNCSYTHPRYRKPPANARPAACSHCCNKYNNGKFSKNFLLKWKAREMKT